jgi:L-rhamnose-H+ transport protein
MLQLRYRTGQPMAHLAVARGANPLFHNYVVYVVLLWGGLTTNLIWCMALNIRNHSSGNYTDRRAPLAGNYVFAALAATV